MSLRLGGLIGRGRRGSDCGAWTATARIWAWRFRSSMICWMCKGNRDALGKTVGKDARQGKLTFPVCWAWKQAGSVPNG